MQTKTDHTIALTEDETRGAVAAYLRSRDVPVPADLDGIKIKWTSKGEATVSFSVGEGATVTTTNPPGRT